MAIITIHNMRLIQVEHLGFRYMNSRKSDFQLLH